MIQKLILIVAVVASLALAAFAMPSSDIQNKIMSRTESMRTKVNEHANRVIDRVQKAANQANQNLNQGAERMKRNGPLPKINVPRVSTK